MSQLYLVYQDLFHLVSVESLRGLQSLLLRQVRVGLEDSVDQAGTGGSLASSQLRVHVLTCVWDPWQKAWPAWPGEQESWQPQFQFFLAATLSGLGGTGAVLWTFTSK